MPPDAITLKKFTLSLSVKSLIGFAPGFGMDDDGSSWVGSTIAFGGIVGSVFAG